MSCITRRKFRTKGNVGVDRVKTDVKSYLLRNTKKSFMDAGYSPKKAEQMAKEEVVGSLRFLGKKEGKNVFIFSWDATDLVNVYPGLIRKMQSGGYLVDYERTLKW